MADEEKKYLLVTKGDQSIPLVATDARDLALAKKMKERGATIKRISANDLKRAIESQLGQGGK